MKTVLKVVKLGVKKGYTPSKYYSLVIPMSEEVIKRYKLEDKQINLLAVSIAKNALKNYLNIWNDKEYEVFKANDPVKDYDYCVIDSDWNSANYNSLLGFGMISEVPNE